LKQQTQNWRGKISNHAQLGGIETSILDNGAGRGTRIAWINTGAGLRYKVVIDRAMDIAEAAFNQHGLSWLSHLGTSGPQPFSDRGLEWLRTFGGGLVVTCGLSHFGPPESDENGDRGLHGRISNQPAEIISIVQPDPVRGKMDMRISGRIKESRLFGPRFELERTISGVLGEPVIRIHDEVVNVANTPSPHMLLYHCNFGWPLADEGADILWNGSWETPQGKNDKIFREGNDFHKCPPPLEIHKGVGEAVAFINPEADSAGMCSCGLYNAKLGIAVALRFNKAQLPALTNWQHWGIDEYVTGLEPGTNPPIGQNQAREQNKLIILQPGEKKIYDLEIAVLHEEATIKEFLKKHKL
jgi:hypothetical protein